MDKKPLEIINQDIMDVLYKVQRKNNFRTLRDLYLFLHYNYPLIISDLHDVLSNYIKKNNIKFMYPITKPIYILKPFNYLFERKYINYIPSYNLTIENIHQNYNIETRQFFRLEQDNTEL